MTSMTMAPTALVKNVPLADLHTFSCPCRRFGCSGTAEDVMSLTLLHAGRCTRTASTQISPAATCPRERQGKASETEGNGEVGGGHAAPFLNLPAGGAARGGAHAPAGSDAPSAANT
jgi:hypothetical protein